MANNLRVVIAAAGVGSRMGSEINKQYMPLSSRPVLAYSLDVCESLPDVDEIVVVANLRDIEYCLNQIVIKNAYQKVSRVIAGGAERQDSVWCGLKSLGADTDLVAVHDGARPFVTPSLFKKLIAEASKWGAAIPGIAVKETLKRVDTEGFVETTLDRSSLVTVQTPQIFKYRELVQSYQYAAQDNFRGTDDAMIYEKYIGRVKVVPGEARNIKITVPEDLAIAEHLVNFGVRLSD